MVVGEYLLIGSRGTSLCRIGYDHVRLVRIDEDTQLAAEAADIVKLQRNPIVQPLLNAEAEYVVVRAAAVRVHPVEGEQTDRRGSRPLFADVLHQGNVLVEGRRVVEPGRLCHPRRLTGSDAECRL